MEEERKLNIQTLKNPAEKEIIMLLQNHEEYLYGNIIKELNLSHTKGQEHIYSLVSKGLIKYIGRTSKLELAVDLKAS